MIGFRAKIPMLKTKQLSESCHTKYTGAWFINDSILPKHMPQHGSSKYKKYFITFHNENTNHRISNDSLMIKEISYDEWKLSSSRRKTNTNDLIKNTITLFTTQQANQTLPNQKAILQKIETGELDYEFVSEIFASNKQS